MRPTAMPPLPAAKACSSGRASWGAGGMVRGRRERAGLRE